ncbi:hypothetical protein ANO14919_052190 [Xylariales sp. No.14919]|nr:hypothetical protein ANO14919_052190 [Xylariales sp. No.14919]
MMSKPAQFAKLEAAYEKAEELYRALVTAKQIYNVLVIESVSSSNSHWQVIGGDTQNQ